MNKIKTQDFRGFGQLCFIHKNDTYYIQGHFIGADSKLNFGISAFGCLESDN